LNSRDILTIDNRSLSRQVVEHLIQLGHKKIAIIGDDFQMHPVHQERLLGYKDALAGAGLVFDDKLVISGDDNPERRPIGSLSSGIEGISKLLNSGREFTAIFAIGESIAKGILGTLYARGIKVPDQISVAGFDDFPETALLCPALTTVSIPYKKIAYEYTRQLHRIVRGLNISADEDLSELTGNLQIRKSTAPPPVVR
jgi:DNA-binding LacI/PurR family transcriptional regulator